MRLSYVKHQCVQVRDNECLSQGGSHGDGQARMYMKHVKETQSLVFSDFLLLCEEKSKAWMFPRLMAYVTVWRVVSFTLQRIPGGKCIYGKEYHF